MTALLTLALPFVALDRLDVRLDQSNTGVFRNTH
jgi:hypothetical protein